MKTYEIIKWYKGFMVMTNCGVNNSNRFYFKTKTAVTAKEKELKRAGYVKA